MAKKITKWEPEDFELEMTTHWSFPKRGDGQLTMQNGEVTGRRIFPEIFFSAIQKKEI